MSDPTASDHTRTTPLGAMFDLAPEDVGLLEGFCGDALREAGVDGAGFFSRLQQGQSFGAALGLPSEVCELIYARAHRWFMVDRPDRAEPLFRALCVADGQVADYWVGLGVCLRLRQDAAGAALAYGMAAKLRPDWAVPAFHAGELAIHSRDFALAARHITQFRKFASADTPQHMLVEAERMEQALVLQRTAAAVQGPAA